MWIYIWGIGWYVKDDIKDFYNGVYSFYINNR